MTISQFFASLGAPLKNVRTSWGAVGADGTVVLRVWQHEIARDGFGYFVRIARPETVNAERLEHIAMISNGSKAICIPCIERKFNMTRSGRIQSFSKDYYIAEPFGTYTDELGNVYLRLTTRLSKVAK